MTNEQKPESSRSGEGYNTRRRERYHNDPEYREQVRERNRKAYRRNNNWDMKKPNINDLKPIVTDVEFGDKVIRNMEVVGTTSLAKALGKTSLTIRNWIKNGVIPETELFPVTAQSNYQNGCYSIEESRAIFEGYLEHFDQYGPNIGSRHEDSVKVIQEKVEAARASDRRNQ